MHGDLHGGNILLDGDGHARLTDFGLSLLAEATPRMYGSMHGGGFASYRAPELHDPEQFDLVSTRPTFPSDVYAFGCTCVEVVSSEQRSQTPCADKFCSCTQGKFLFTIPMLIESV